MKLDSWEISRRGLVGGATCRKTPISQYTLEKNPMTRHLFEDNPVDEGTTKGALTPLCIVWKNPQVPHTALQEACHPVNNSRYTLRMSTLELLGFFMAFHDIG